MQASNRAFFIRGDDGEEYGPVEMEELREWVQENRAGLGTVVRLDEMGALWQPWQYYPELVALLAEVRVTGPGSGPSALVVAPVWRRLTAWLMDVMLLSILFIPIRSLLAIFMPVDEIIQAAINASTIQDMPTQTLHQVVAFEIIVNACLVLYLTGFHAAHGMTPAKAILRIRVVDQNGVKPTLTKAFLRALALVFSVNLLFIPLAYAFFNPQRRTFHDFVAGTYVVEA